jgi:4-hydroxy-tetrahydrodipicolinate reductase
VLAPALQAAGHHVTGAREAQAGFDAAVDFTRPDAVVPNVRGALALGVPCVIGTSGFDEAPVDEAARAAGLPCFYAPNFALGAVLMMRFAAEAARHLPRAEIVELHNEAKVDAPSGTAKATAALLGGDVLVHSVRLPGLVAHQEVLLGGEGQLLTIRHDAFSREAYVPGVLLALERLGSLPPGLTVGLDRLLDQ